MIEIKNLTKRFGRILAVNELSLTIPAGRIFGFIGPNGAGKTTTIKMMAGLLAPTSGRISICGIDLATHPVAAKLKIGFIPDRPYLYEKITAMEFLQFKAELYGVDGAGFTTKATEKLEQFSLLDWADELIESFSHGMKQRLIMAAALLHGPQVLIVDEPMVGLDPVAIRMVKILFKTLAGEGVTIFMSTHTLPIAEDVCDRIAVIHKGKLLAIGSTDELRRDARLQDAALEDVFIKLTAENGGLSAE